MKRKTLDVIVGVGLVVLAGLLLVAYLAAGLLFLLGVAGLIHAAATPGSKGFAVPEPAAKKLITAYSWGGQPGPQAGRTARS